MIPFAFNDTQDALAQRDRFNAQILCYAYKGGGQSYAKLVSAALRRQSSSMNRFTGIHAQDFRGNDGECVVNKIGVDGMAEKQEVSYLISSSYAAGELLDEASYLRTRVHDTKYVPTIIIKMDEDPRMPSHPVSGGNFVTRTLRKLQCNLTKIADFQKGTQRSVAPSRDEDIEAQEPRDYSINMGCNF